MELLACGGGRANGGVAVGGEEFGIARGQVPACDRGCSYLRVVVAYKGDDDLRVGAFGSDLGADAMVGVVEQLLPDLGSYVRAVDESFPHLVIIGAQGNVNRDGLWVIGDSETY